MSTYGFDPESGTLTVSWPIATGQRVGVVQVLPKGTSTDRVDHLVHALNSLSEALWDTYVHPASQFGDPSEVNGEAWRWDGERQAFDDALKAIEEPHLPSNGSMLHSYIHVEECGHRVGRALHLLDLGPEFTALIRAQVEEEQEAVAAAESGDLAGRAAQAVSLSRIGASPTQVQVAWQTLVDSPLDCHDQLMADFEPSAAAIAAAGCLRQAALITAEASGEHWTDVVLEADNIQALPVLTPTAVLTMLEEGASEREAVTRLLVEAHAVAQGRLSDLDHLAELMSQVEGLQEAGVSEADLELNLTTLDPRRPARDLLEDLLIALEGCFVLWRDCLSEEVLPGDEVPELELIDDDDEADREQLLEQDREFFSRQLRSAMAATEAPS